MKREDWRKVYEPREESLDIRVRNTLRMLDDGTKRRMSMKKMFALALAASLALAAVAAVAASGIFSASYDAVRLASRALENEYGITEEMQTYFARAMDEKDGVTTVVFSGIEDMRHVLGQYTVKIEDGNATVSWSHDGQSTEGELDAHAWGAGQIGILIDMAKNEQGFARGYRKAQEIRAEMDEEENAESITKGDGVTTALDTQESLDAAGVTVSEQEAIVIAKEAFAEGYDLTQEQLDLMQYEKDYAGYTYAIVDGKPICEVWFWLHQQEDEYHTEDDGLYWARINAQSGVVEDMYYDSALAGNG